MFEQVVLSCRAGFEGECLAEIREEAMLRHLSGSGKAVAGAGVIDFDMAAGAAWTLVEGKPFRELVFARQWFAVARTVTALPVGDRVGPLLEVVRQLARPVFQVVVETADTEAGKLLSPLCRGVEPLLRQGIETMGLLQPEADRQLHCYFQDTATARIGFSPRGRSASAPMGIPRLKSSKSAPSRAALKLEEAVGHFLGEKEANKRLRRGLSAIDLGAAPGGWTWYLAGRGLKVTAIDRGRLEPRVLAMPGVRHEAADAFRYVPPQPVAWLVCDVVESPQRIAEVVLRWARGGWCREAIFNLKLPMKKRYEALKGCRELLREGLQGRMFELNFKQLYHDREEVTGHLRLV
ncbi:MAG: 23S rRNA (cytidine(2498)-2'-O)-methyltransferase RlmM [Magnetococcales bacterium]|nr:23S rRNA (cytidine(2498)-2'-O)-methyltransferase RlmM [Magnetococcales bacterium]